MNKPLRVAYKPFRAMNMKVNTSKRISFYTQGQQFVARVLFTVWLLASVSPEGALATPKRQMVPATTTSPGDSSLTRGPSTPTPEGQLPPDSSGSLLSSSVASTPCIGVDSSPAAPADTPQDQASELTNKLVSLYSADDKLPKLIEDDDIPEQDIDQYYVRLQAVVQEQAASAESAAARDKVVGEKKAIQVHQLFDELAEGKKGEKPIGKVLLLGGAGIGKTTLMHHISHQWAKGRLWKGKYDYLFRVRLKELLNDSWKSECNPDDLDEHPLACFIHHCLRNQRTQLPLPRSKRKAFKLCSLEEIKGLLEDPASQPSVLLLVDGYDEIASQSQQGIVKDIIDEILEQKRAIMTSRPNAADQKLRKKFDRQVESQGLDRTGIDQYIDLQFGEDQAGQALKDFLTNNRQILGMCEVPINTALLCIVWRDPKIRERLQKQTGEDLKLGELYEELVVWLGKRYMKKFEDRDHTTLTEEFILKHHPVVKTLKEVAYTSFTGEGKEQSAGTLGIAGGYIADTALEQPDADIDIDKVYQYGLLRAEGIGKKLKDKTHYFIHLTFQEYLTALRLSEALSEPQGAGVRKVATHLAEHRNEPRYLMTLKFLAGLVSKSNDTALVQRFWEAVSCNVEGVLELGIASKVGLLMHLMAQSTTNGTLDARIPNREKLQKLVDEEVVTNLARWQEQLIASGYKSTELVSKLCAVIYQEQPEDISSLSAALEIGVALGSQVVEEEQPLAGHLEKLLDSSLWQVQALAVAKLAQVLDDKVDRAQISRLLGKLVELYQGENTARQAFLCIARLTELDQASVVEKLEKRAKQGSEGFSTSDKDARSSALSLMGKLFERDAELAQPILEAAQRGIKDQEWPVRSSALSLMGKLVESAPELAETILEAAKRGITDQEGSVRSRALSLMGQLVERDAELAQPILAAAQRGCTDKAESVRSRALSLMGQLVERDAELAQPILAAAQRGCTDKDRSVKRSALSLMCKLVEVAPKRSDQLLAAAQRGFQDQERPVTSGDLSLMRKLVKVAPELAPEILEAAQRWFTDQEGYVRYSALSLMCELVEVAPELAPEILEAAQRWFTDQEGSVRSRALSLMCKLVEVAPELAPEILEAAQRGFTDQEGDVRSSALSLMCKLVEVAPELAPEILEAAQRGFTDFDRYVRSSALDLMCKLVEVDPERADQLLAAAQRWFKDSHYRVRYSALDLMCKLVEVASELAPEMLAAAQRGVTDQEGDVRSSALDLMCKLVEVVPELAPEMLAAAQRGVTDQEGDVRSRALFPDV